MGSCVQSSVLLLPPHTPYWFQPGAFPWGASLLVLESTGSPWGESLGTCPPAPPGSLLGPQRHSCWGPGDPPDLMLLFLLTQPWLLGSVLPSLAQTFPQGSHLPACGWGAQLCPALGPPAMPCQQTLLWILPPLKPCPWGTARHEAVGAQIDPWMSCKQTSLWSMYLFTSYKDQFWNIWLEQLIRLEIIIWHQSLMISTLLSSGKLRSLVTMSSATEVSKEPKILVRRCKSHAEVSVGKICDGFDIN